MMYAANAFEHMGVCTVARSRTETDSQGNPAFEEFTFYRDIDPLVSQSKEPAKDKWRLDE